MGKKIDEKTIELFYEIHAQELRNSDELKELLRSIKITNEDIRGEEVKPFFRFMSYVLGEDSEMKTYNTKNLEKDLPKMLSVTGNNHWQLNRILGGIERVAREKAKKEPKEYLNDDSKNSPTP